MNRTIPGGDAFEMREFVLVPTKNRRGQQIAEILERRMSGHVIVRRWNTAALGATRVGWSLATEELAATLVIGTPEPTDPRLLQIREWIERNRAEVMARQGEPA